MLQTFLIMLLSIGLIGALIFYVIPYMIRFAGSLGGIALLPNSDTVPPVVPTYSVPYVATNSAALKVDGYAEVESDVIAVVNGQEVGNTMADSAGTFSIDINLEDGQNTLAFYSKDSANNESLLGKALSVMLDKQAPEFEWLDPEDNKIITSLRDRTIKVNGKTESTAKVTLNDRYVFVGGDGVFQEPFQLNEGENILKLIVTDQAGNFVEQMRKVTFKP